MSTSDAVRDPSWPATGRDLRHDAARRRAARGHLAHRRRQAADRRAARLARRRLHRGRLARREPEGRRVLPARAAGAAARARARWSRSARPGGSRARSTPTTRCATCSRRTRRTVCIVGKSWDYHVPEALGTTLDEGVAMVADSVEFLQRRRAARCSSTPSTSSTATSATPSSACGCSRARRRRAPTASCCATPTAARCPHEVERIVARASSTTSAPTSAIGVHLHDDTGCGVANALAGVRGGATQVQGTINGYGERTGNCNLTTIIPNLTLKMGIETHARATASSGSRRSRTTSPSS